MFFRRRVEPGQLIRLLTAPLQQLDPQRGEIAVHNFRLALRGGARRLLFGDQMQADAGHQTPGAAGALRHRRLADALGQQARDAAARVELRGALQRAVHHQSDAFDGEAGFGDIGGEHHFAAAGWRGQDCAALRRQRQRAIERRQINVVRHARLQLALHSLNLRHAGQKQQQRAALFAQQLRRFARHRLFKAQRGAERGEAARHGIAAPFGDDQRRVGQQRRETRVVQRRRHQQDFQIVP